ncbi:hypothetical protein CGRA01v4_00275 [Colletotrichum graminicola]|nr:hypothetical protein CGRA01v4_00275 [Colletotrichum graminicola]
MPACLGVLALRTGRGDLACRRRYTCVLRTGRILDQVGEENQQPLSLQMHRILGHFRALDVDVYPLSLWKGGKSRSGGSTEGCVCVCVSVYVGVVGRATFVGGCGWGVPMAGIRI